MGSNATRSESAAVRDDPPKNRKAAVKRIPRLRRAMGRMMCAFIQQTLVRVKQNRASKNLILRLRRLKLVQNFGSRSRHRGQPVTGIPGVGVGAVIGQVAIGIIRQRGSGPVGKLIGSVVEKNSSLAFKHSFRSE